jgi:hypothetical protein
MPGTQRRLFRSQALGAPVAMTFPWDLGYADTELV